MNRQMLQELTGAYNIISGYRKAQTLVEKNELDIQVVDQWLKRNERYSIEARNKADGI